MKLRNSIPSYFWHELSAIAIHRGWDLEGDVVDFLLGIESRDDYEAEALYTLKDDNETVLNMLDVITIVRTHEITESAKRFFIALNKMLREREVDDLSAVFVSMHSGSSDYFLECN